MAEVPIFTEHLAPILMEPERQEEFLYFGESADSDSAHSPSERSASDILPAMSQQQLGRQLGNDPQGQQSLDARYRWDPVHGTSLNHLAPPFIPAWQWANGGTNHTSRAISSGQCPVYTSASGDQYTILPQTLYEGGLRAARLHPVIQFYGFNLQSAFQEDVQGLVDPNGQAFQVQLKQKMTVIFLFPGWERYSRQVHVHTANKTSHTRGKLANVIAKEMVQFMAATSKEGRPLRSQEGKIVELQDLVLVDICHVSQGSLQPTIGVIRRS
ncbi:hypothetical protein VTO73DRAFT_1952 [Trametes versicolor]